MHEDPETMEQFCRRVSPRLVGALTLHCGNRSIAEELAQETLARACERWDEVSQKPNPTGWAYRVAFNLTASSFRRRASERRAQRRFPVRDMHESDGADRLALLDALRNLPDRQRAAVVLRFYGQFSVAETAEAMGCAQGTVRALTSQGVERLRKAFPIEIEQDEVETDRG